MFNQILTAVCSANHSQLQSFLARNPPEAHASMRAGFAQHMANIAEFCMQGYQGAGTLSTAFIRELHRMHYPPGYHEVSVTPQGEEVVTVVPGEYKTLPNALDSVAFPGTIIRFTPPNEVAESMEALVARVNAQLLAAENTAARLDIILWFSLDFSSIHPFSDANGRLSFILSDLLLLKETLPPAQMGALKEIDKDGLYRAVGLTERERDIVYLREFTSRTEILQAEPCSSIG